MSDDADDEADFASHMGEIVPLILEMAESYAPAEAPGEAPVPAVEESGQIAPAEPEAPAAVDNTEETGSPATSETEQTEPSAVEKIPSEEPLTVAESEPVGSSVAKEEKSEGSSPASETERSSHVAEGAKLPMPTDAKIAAPRIELPPFRQKRVVVSLLKGGVGKTTITCFLATALQKIWDDAASDGRVLVVDTDPQGSATDFFLEGASVSPERSLRALFEPYPFPGPELIQHTRYSRIDLIAAHPSMAEVAPTADEQLEDHLAWYLANAANDYSLILLDTPPSDTLALRNALMASSGIFMPLDPSRQSLKTFIQFSQTVRRYKNRNQSLQIYGVIFSRYDSRQSLDRNIRDTISEQLAGSGLRLYEVPRRAAIADCYNNYTGYEALAPSKEADAIRTFRDLAMQVLSH
ncbi:MAG: ParA family protein [Pyramidobacter sp.]|nr:ParA family protein [Pyramidobacter sp.]